MEIYFPLEKTGLLDSIPDGDQVLYSTLCEATFRTTKATGTGMKAFTKQWITSVILTNRGVAYLEKVVNQPTGFDPKEIPATAQYIPWYYIKWVTRGRFQIGDTTFKLIRTPESESEEDFSKRFHAFGGKFKPLLKEIKRASGMAHRGLKIFLGTLCIGAIIFFIGFFAFGYPLESLLSSYYWGSDFLWFALLTTAIGFVISWIIFSRRASKSIQKYEEKDLPTTLNWDEIEK